MKASAGRRTFVEVAVVRPKRRSYLMKIVRFIAAGLAVCGVVATAAAAAPTPQTAPGDPLDPRTYDPASRLFLVVHATGVQKYTCQADATWLFTDPEATLVKTNGKAKAIGTHYLNFATGRPVWEARDGSSVEAARKASAPGGTGNIALLLLRAVATASGDDDRLTDSTWVQRLNTSGGVAPAGTCTPGDRAAVPYSTDYYFWRASED
jgi:hypothetical protein